MNVEKLRRIGMDVISASVRVAMVRILEGKEKKFASQWNRICIEASSFWALHLRLVSCIFSRMFLFRLSRLSIRPRVCITEL